MKTEFNTALIGLDPLFSTNVKLFVKDVLNLVPTANTLVELFNLYDHTIKFVEIVGIVVAVESLSSKTMYTVDDSSGTISCCLWSSSVSLDYVPFEIGTAVRVLGKVTDYMSERQVIIYDIFKLDDPNEELSHYIKTAVLEIEYQKPYCLPDYIESNKELLTSELKENVTKVDSKFKDFTEEVLKFLQENANQPFTIWLPRENQKLIEMATHIVESKDQTNKTKQKLVLRLFEKAIKSLGDRGLIVKSKKMESMFELVNVREVENFILSAISTVLKTATHQRGGVKMDYIRFIVEKEYPNMDRSNIDRMVIGLFDRGLIYPSAYGEYKLTW